MSDSNDTATKITNKSARLVYLVLKSLLSQPVSVTDYAARFGVDKGNASREIRNDLPTVLALLEDQAPELKVNFQNLISLIPLVPGANRTAFTVTLSIDNETGKLSWEDFVQHLYDHDGQLLNTVCVSGNNSYLY